MAARCPVCARGLDGALVACASCDARYHRDCLAYNGRCAVYGCARVAGEGKTERVELTFDSPGVLALSWTAGGLGFLGISCWAQGSPAGLLLLVCAVAAGARVGRFAERRVVDAKTRVIWRQWDGRAEPLLEFERCRKLVMRRQPTLGDGRDNHRFVLELTDDRGEEFVLGDHVTPQEAERVGTLLALAPERT